MPQLRDTLAKIRTLPESARILLAGICFVFSVFVVFSIWQATSTTNLALLSTDSSITKPTSVNTINEPPSPTSVLGESFGSIFKSATPGLTNMTRSLRVGASIVFTTTASGLSTVAVGLKNVMIDLLDPILELFIIQ